MVGVDFWRFFSSPRQADRLCGSETRITVGNGDIYGDMKLTTDHHVGLKVRAAEAIGRDENQKTRLIVGCGIIPLPFSKVTFSHCSQLNASSCCGKKKRASVG